MRRIGLVMMRQHMADNPSVEELSDPVQESLPILWTLLGRHVAFHRRLVGLTGNVKASLLLSQAIYWARHGRDLAPSGGWFHKTSEQWMLETGLSAKEQLSARGLLRRLDLLQDQRMEMPARLHFRLNLEKLGLRLAGERASDLAVVDWGDRGAVARLLGPSLAFHRRLVTVGGGVHAGLMLSHVLHLARARSHSSPDCWIGSSAANWVDAIGLTRREQEVARRDLVRIGLWEERVSGVPPRLMVRVRLDDLLTLLACDAITTGQTKPPDVDPACGLAAGGPMAPKSETVMSQNGETRMAQNGVHVATKAPSLFSPNRHHCSAETAKLDRVKTTSKLIQQQHRARKAGTPDCAAGGGCCELIFPDQLLPQEREAARLLLRHCGEQAQALLDELAGRLQARHVRNPMAYLRGLVANAVAGRFVPVLAPRVAADRVQRQQAADLQREREVEEQRLEAERATPEHQARVRAHREKLKALRDAIRRRMATGPP